MKLMRTALVCIVTQRGIAIPYRYFKTTYMTPEGGTYRLPQNIGKELPLLAV